jgi:hypothetical protein
MNIPAEPSDELPEEEGRSDELQQGGRIIERPDGFYWIAEDRLGEVGPFDSYELAEADREAAAGEAPEPGESLEEAEDEIGINDWLDRDTGEPAEGQSPPRLGED